MALKEVKALTRKLPVADCSEGNGATLAWRGCGSIKGWASAAAGGGGGGRGRRVEQLPERCFRERMQN